MLHAYIDPMLVYISEQAKIYLTYRKYHLRRKIRREGDLGTKSTSCLVPVKSFLFDYAFEIIKGFPKLLFTGFPKLLFKGFPKPLFKGRNYVLIFLHVLKGHNKCLPFSQNKLDNFC